MLPEQDNFEIFNLVAAGKKEEVDESIKILRDAGFGVLPIPVRGLSKPEVIYKGHNYHGVDQIRGLINPKLPNLET